MRHFSADAGGFATTMEVLGMTAGMNTRPAIGLLRHGPRPRDHEEVPLHSVINTPTGRRAEVIGYRGFRRQHRIYLVCRYLEPENKRYDVVLLLPELACMVELPKERA